MEDVKTNNQKSDITEVKEQDKTIKETEGKIDNVKEEITYEITYETTLKQRHVDKINTADSSAGDGGEKTAEVEDKMKDEKEKTDELKEVKEEVSYEKYARMSFREKLALGGSGIPGVSLTQSFNSLPGYITR